MGRAAVRSNLSIAGQEEVRDPSGQTWTVRIGRPTDPRGRPWSNWYPVALVLSRLQRFVRRDRRWNVEVAGTSGDASSVVAVLESKDAAIDEAIKLVDRLNRGDHAG